MDIVLLDHYTQWIKMHGETVKFITLQGFSKFVLKTSANATLKTIQYLIVYINYCILHRVEKLSCWILLLSILKEQCSHASYQIKVWKLWKAGGEGKNKKKKKKKKKTMTKKKKTTRKTKEAKVLG
jgi:hypothetical protein